MLQPIRLHGRLSLSLLALMAVAIAVLVSISLARITTATRTGAAPASIAATEQVLAVRPIVGTPADRTACAPGAYVSGDMAGNSSPSEIYAAQCPDR